MEILAIPLFGDDVAPRFCAASEFLIAPLPGGALGELRHATVASGSWPRRLSQLTSMGVTVLLCGGFDRRFLPLAEGLGLRVVWGLTGLARDRAADYARRHRQGAT